MQTIKVSSLIFDGLDYSAPSTVEEYNALARKRTNPVLEDAIDNIMKHKVLSQFRNKFLDAIEEKFAAAPNAEDPSKGGEGITEAKRINNGTEKTPKWEPDMPYMKRLVTVVLKARGLDPTVQANVDAFAQELRALAQSTLSAVKFNVEEREPGTGVPVIAKTYTDWAKQAVEGGKADKLLSLLNSALGTTHVLVGDTEKDVETVAKAIAANEKRKRDAQLAAAKAEYGLADATATAATA